MSWQLVQVAPNSEARIERIFVSLSIPTHIFRFYKKLVVRHKKVERLVPIFPGYVFAAVGNCWKIVRNVVGVFDFVRVGRDIAMVGRYLEELLKVADENDVIHLSTKPNPRMMLGDKVSVKIHGTACNGEFQRYAKNDRALVILDGKFPAIVDECDCIKIVDN